MDCSTPGFPVLHYLLEFAQIHVHWVGDAIQPSHPLLPPFSPALNLSQHQSLFQWVSSSHQVAKVFELQLQHQSFQWIFIHSEVLWGKCKLLEDTGVGHFTPDFPMSSSLGHLKCILVHKSPRSTSQKTLLNLLHKSTFQILLTIDFLPNTIGLAKKCASVFL